jgi:hypothetical protein
MEALDEGGTSNDKARAKASEILTPIITSRGSNAHHQSDSFRSHSLSLSGAVRHASKGRLCIHVTVYKLDSRLYAYPTAPAPLHRYCRPAANRPQSIPWVSALRAWEGDEHPSQT